VRVRGRARLSDAMMQALARQMNLSETTFVFPSERGTARVRIFTPGFEMRSPGTPTLGTASVIAAGRDRVVLDLNAGLVPVTRGETAGEVDWTLRAAKPPATRAVEATRDELARWSVWPRARCATSRCGSIPAASSW